MTDENLSSQIFQFKILLCSTASQTHFIHTIKQHSHKQTVFQSNYKPNKQSNVVKCNNNSDNSKGTSFKQYSVSTKQNYTALSNGRPPTPFSFNVKSKFVNQIKKMSVINEQSVDQYNFPTQCSINNQCAAVNTIPFPIIQRRNRKIRTRIRNNIMANGQCMTVPSVLRMIEQHSGHGLKMTEKSFEAFKLKSNLLLDISLRMFSIILKELHESANMAKQEPIIVRRNNLSNNDAPSSSTQRSPDLKRVNALPQNATLYSIDIESETKLHHELNHHHSSNNNKRQELDKVTIGPHELRNFTEEPITLLSYAFILLKRLLQNICQELHINPRNCCNPLFHRSNTFNPDCVNCIISHLINGSLSSPNEFQFLIWQLCIMSHKVS